MGTFVVVAAIVLAVGAVVAWHDRTVRGRDRPRDTAAPLHRFANGDLDGRSSTQAMNAGATIVRRNVGGTDPLTPSAVALSDTRADDA